MIFQKEHTDILNILLLLLLCFALGHVIRLRTRKSWLSLVSENLVCNLSSYDKVYCTHVCLVN